MFQVPDLLAKEVARFLENEIIFGNLAPDERLVEEDLVKKYGVSRSPVREALRILEQDGLTIRESRRGARVAPVSLGDLDEVYSCRLVLEGLAAEGAAVNRKPADIEAIYRSLKLLENAYRKKNIREYFERNVELTKQIHLSSGNATLRRLLGNIDKQALRYRYLAYSRRPEIMQYSIEGNREIVEAIERQRGRNARLLTEDLIQKSWQVIREHVGGSAGSDGSSPHKKNAAAD